MPRSHMASKPAPNPPLSSFLTWIKNKSYFAAIPADSNDIAALAGIDRENELVVILVPSSSNPHQDMSAEKSKPAFIKINMRIALVPPLSSKIIGKSSCHSAPRYLSPLNYFRTQLGMRHKRKLHLLPSLTWSQSLLVQSFPM